MECEALNTLELSFNQITTLNNSLLPLKSLEALSLENNLLTEFSFSEIIGLERLSKLDLSYNQISSILGPASVRINFYPNLAYSHV